MTGKKPSSKKRLFKPFLVLVTLFLLSASATPSSEVVPGQSPMPDELYAGRHLDFASLDRALTSEGLPDPELLGASGAGYMARVLATMVQKDGCIRVDTGSSIDLSPTHSGLDHTIETADHILVGQVVGRAVGTTKFRVGTLLRVETSSTLYGAPRPSFFLFLPLGSFAHRGKKYCLENRRYPRLPELGEEILVLYKEQIHTGERLAIVPTQIVVLPSDGEPILGDVYRDLRSKGFLGSKEEFLREILSRIEGAEK